MRKDSIISLLLAQMLLWASLTEAHAAPGDIYVVVGTASSVQAMSKKDVVSLFTGRTRNFPGGVPATPLDHPRDSTGRASFYRAATGMDMSRVNSYWSRLLFTGQVQPPLSVDGDAAVVQLVKRDPQAIGYLTQEPTDPALRVVLHLHSASP